MVNARFVTFFPWQPSVAEGGTLGAICEQEFRGCSGEEETRRLRMSEFVTESEKEGDWERAYIRFLCFGRVKKEIRASHYVLASLVIAGPCPENSKFLWRTPHLVLIRLPLQISVSLPQHVPMHKHFMTATHLPWTHVAIIYAKRLYNWKTLHWAVNQWPSLLCLRISVQ